MSSPKIAIIGAGLGGLSLAKVLYRHGVSATVFERDATSATRTQGGSLDLHVKSGQFALKEAGVYDEWRKIMRKEGQDWTMVNKNGEVVIFKTASDDDESSPEADRPQLRHLFIDTLPEIKWGCQVTAITKEGDQHKLTFTDGHTELFDYVVGADGVWSRVRPLLTDVRPKHSGVIFTELSIKDCAKRYPDIANMVGRGSFLALSDNKGLLTQQNSNDVLRVYAVLSVPEDWVESSKIDWKNPRSAKESILAHYSDWDENLLNLVKHSEDYVFPRQIYAIAKEHTTWAHQTGLTMIGDAAHVITPFSGQGANMAMQDGAELGLAIAKGISEGNVDEQIAQFEKGMFERAALAAGMSEHMLRVAIAPGAPNKEAFERESSKVESMKKSLEG